MATYVNDLRLKEIATGDESGTWGTSTNTNLELIAEAFSFGTESITTNADTHTTTIADGATDPGRSIYLQYTGTLDSTCTITIGPNTVSKLWFIENATSGSQDIIIKQGSGATVTVPNGNVKAIYSDGAGSGGKMVDAFTNLNVNGLKIEVDGNEAALTVTSTDADASLGPLIVFRRESASPADDDLLGRVNFNGFNDASEGVTYGRIQTTIRDASDGTEDGELTLSTIVAGSNRSRAKFGATETVFNEGSVDLDFRVETDTDANALFVQGSSNRVMLGFNAQIAVAGVNPHLGIVGTDNGGTTLAVVRYSADTSGCRFILGKSRNGSIATAGGTIVQSGDTVGLIQFAADDGGDVATKPVQIAAAIDGTPGSDDVPGRLVISTVPDGSATIAEALRITNAGNIGIGDSSPSTKLHVTTSEQDDGITIECTNGGASAGPSLKLDRSSSGPADDDSIGEIEFSGRNDASQAVQYARIFARADDVTDGTEDGELEIQTMLAGTARSRVEFNRTETVFNEDSQNLDFRVESDDNTKMFFIDGGLNRIRIGNANHKQAGSNARMVGISTIDSDAGISIVRHQDSASGPALVFGKSRGTAAADATVVQDGDTLGVIQFAGADGTDIVTLAADIKAAVDGTPGSNDMPGRLVFSTTPDGANSRTERMRITQQGDILINTTTDYGGTVNIKSDASGNSESALALVSTLASAADGPILDLNRQTASPADSDNIGIIKFKSTNSADETIRYAEIDTFIQDVTDGTEDGMIRIRTRLAGTLRSRIEFDQTETVINEDSQDLNFRVESNTNQNMLLVDAGTETVRIGSNAQVSTSTTTLQVTADSGERASDMYRPTSTGTSVVFALFSDVGGTKTKVFEVEANGDIETATGSIGTISDQRLKQDIVDANSQWNDIKALQIRNFRFTNDVNQNGEDALRHIGVVAQEVESAGMTGLVKTRNDEDTGEEIKSVKSSIIYMKAVKALQEAITRIETLEAEVTALKGGG